MITKREVLEHIAENGQCGYTVCTNCPYDKKEELTCNLLKELRKLGAKEMLKTLPREFDKTKILTCVTADQAKIGMKGYFGVTIFDIEQKIKSSEIDELWNVENSTFKLISFQRKSDGEHFPLFYPIDEVEEIYIKHFDDDFKYSYVLQALNSLENERQEENEKLKTRLRTLMPCGYCKHSENEPPEICTPCLCGECDNWEV